MDDSVDDIDLFADIDEHVRRHREFLDELFGNYKLFSAALVSDVKEAHAALKITDTQFQRRVYFRSFFAAVEGMLFARRYIVSSIIQRDPNCLSCRKLSIGDRAILDEVSFELCDDGAVRERTRNFQPFLKMVRFTSRIYFTFFNTSHRTEYGGDGWRAFRNAAAVRDRITHPKSPEALDISDSELDDLYAASRWVNSQLMR